MAELNFNIGGLGSISHLTYRDLGSMYSLETRSLTDKYDILINREAEASAQAAPSSIWNRLLSRSTSETLGVPEHWLSAGGQDSVESERNVVDGREAGLDDNLQATLVQRTPTPCSPSEGLKHA